jgi:hypothetical protein
MKLSKLSLPDIKDKSKKANSNYHNLPSAGSSNRSSEASFEIGNCCGF